jgi:hypothetical protein
MVMRLRYLRYNEAAADRTFSDMSPVQTGSKMISPRKCNADDECKLSPAQQKVLAALMAGRTYLDAAKEAGVTDRTIRRWRESSPEFELALRDQIQGVREAIAIAASMATQAAVKTLADIAANPDHPQVLRAIRMLFELCGPLPPIKAPTSKAEVADEQSLAMLQRFEVRGF